MPEANNESECFYENLVDIGLDEEMISRCMRLKKEGKNKELLGTLQNSRRDLLDDIHGKQKELDCLDYLLHRLSKNENRN